MHQTMQMDNTSLSKHLLAFVTLAVVPLVDTKTHAQVVINEFVYDNTGVDSFEYVELYNAGDTEVDLEGWVLETGDEFRPQHSFELSGFKIEANSFLVAGTDAPNVGFDLGWINRLPNRPAYVFLRQRDGEIVDRVAYEARWLGEPFPPEMVAEGWIWGDQTLETGGMMSWQRWFDGWDTNRNSHDFGQLPWTPGESNNRVNPMEFSSDFEDAKPDDPVQAFPGSYLPGRIIDPTLKSAANADTIPASPDGGQSLILTVPRRGGNLVILESEPASDGMFEAWAFFDANPEPDGQSETWSIGLRGTSDTCFRAPIISNENGNTGVSWTYQVTDEGARLFLIDEGYGRPRDEKRHLGAITIDPEANDGWQRLRLEVAGKHVVGRFGGTYGSVDDGQAIEGEVEAVGIGNFYIGYRREVRDITTARPPTIDSLVVKAEPVRFLRGDCNGDGNTDVSDAVTMLRASFSRGVERPCLSACDVNGDGAITGVVDAIGLLTWMFIGGVEIPAPSPNCGPGSLLSDLAVGCEASPAACP